MKIPSAFRRTSSDDKKSHGSNAGLAGLVTQSTATSFFMARDGSVTEAAGDGHALARLVASNSDALSVIMGAFEQQQLAETRVTMDGASTYWLVAVPSVDGVLVIARDITLSDSVTQALIESRTLLRSLLDQAVTLALEIDASGRIKFVSPAQSLGVDTSDWLGQSARAMLWPAGDAPSRNPLDSQVEKEFDAVPVSYAVGGYRLDMVIQPVLDAEGRYQGARVTCQDVTDHAERMRDARATSLRLNIQQQIMGVLASAETADALLNDAARVLVDTVRAETVWILISHGRGLAPVAAQGGLEISLNLEEIWARCRAQAAEEATGRNRQSMISISKDGQQHLVMLLRAADELQGVVVIARDTKRAPWSEMELDLLQATAGMLTEAFEKATLIDRLHKLSSQDMLTGVQNRRSISETVDQRLKYQRALGQGGCLLFIDLDHFKEINDTLGHQAGDDALKLVADLLANITRPNDAVGRYGGDEFVVWLEGADSDQAIARGTDLIGQMAGVRKALGASDLRLGASVGVCQSDPRREETFDSLAKRADEALYEVKKAGKGQVAVADPLPAGPEVAADE